MPHADTSYFPSGLSKEEVYKQLLEQTRGLLDGQRNWDAAPSHPRFPSTSNPAKPKSNLANVSSLLWHAYSALPAPSSSVNWTGFYIRDDKFPTLASSQESIVRTTTTTVSTTYSDPREQKLLLGPFHGKPACQLIFFGKGVCGTAAMKKETVMVDDVLQFPGHIACDADSRSEVVVPIIVGDETVAILDIDCTETAGFDDVDKKYLEELAVILAEGCDW